MWGARGRRGRLAEAVAKTQSVWQLGVKELKPREELEVELVDVDNKEELEDA